MNLETRRQELELTKTVARAFRQEDIPWLHAQLAEAVQSWARLGWHAEEIAEILDVHPSRVQAAMPVAKPKRVEKVAKP